MKKEGALLVHRVTCFIYTFVVGDRVRLSNRSFFAKGYSQFQSIIMNFRASMFKLPLFLLSVTANYCFAQTSLSFKTNQVDTLYGKAVYDPYRMLEDTGNA